MGDNLGNRTSTGSAKRLRGGWTLLVVGLTILLAGRAAESGAALAPGVHVRSFIFGGETRVYDLYVPVGYDGSTPVPLVVDFHGAGSNRTQERLVSGWGAVANSQGLLVVYPDGLFNTWNAGSCCGGAAAANVDDVGFSRALINQVAAEARVDHRRIYATGISNGGMMTHRLACEAADVFAAFAPLAGFIAVPSCLPSRPLALLSFMGLTDQVVPYAAAAPSFAFWRNNAQCVGVTPDETVVSGDSFCETYTNCSEDLEVGLCSVTASPLFEGHVLYANSDFVIAQVAWEFLSPFRLPPSSLDALKCYKAADRKAPKFVSTTVELADQFGVNDGAFAVTKPVLLCTPASVNGRGINNPGDHLTCYKIKGPKLDPADRPRLDVQNDLGASILEATKPDLLCVPSAKSVLP